MKYIRSVLSGPISALSIVILSAPFWRLRLEEDALLPAVGWTIVWATFEIIWIIRKQSSTPRLLTHLRWGPAAVLTIFIGVVVSYDNIHWDLGLIDNFGGKPRVKKHWRRMELGTSARVTVSPPNCDSLNRTNS